MDYDYDDSDDVTPIDWEHKYKQLKINFDRLDRHNDVLYRVYRAAKLYSKSLDSTNYTQIGFMRDELLARFSEVEDFENGLKNE